MGVRGAIALAAFPMMRHAELQKGEWAAERAMPSSLGISRGVGGRARQCKVYIPNVGTVVQSK
jgi:hypothetical protein